MPDDIREEIAIRIIKTASDNDIKAIYEDAGWWEPSWDRNKDFLKQIVRDSAVFAGAFYKERLIGMGRALSDSASDAYIQDVAVLKEFRSMGTGKKIIRVLISELQGRGVDWIGLIAKPEAYSFYREIGFKSLKDHVPMKYKG